MPPSLQDVKKWVIVALASDEELMEHLVMKGGNAIELLRSRQDQLSRESNYFDLSMEDSFDDDLDSAKARLQRTLYDTFSANGLVVFDYKFVIQPKQVSDDVKDIWGGYAISFKLATPEAVAVAQGNLPKLERLALRVQSNQSSRIEIEISKYEYVAKKQALAIDDHTIYIYSPEMIVFEKLRAICQQNPGYAKIIPGFHPRPRARDFFDIPLMVDQFHIDPAESDNKQLIEDIFHAKRVPLSFIREIPQHLEIHRSDWESLLDTLPASERATTREFDYYAEYVTGLFGKLTFP